MSKEELVEVTLQLPRPVVDWFKDQTGALEEKLKAELVELAWAQIDAANSETLMAKYGLKPVFERYKLVGETK